MKQNLIKLGGLLIFILLLVSVMPTLAFAGDGGAAQGFFQSGNMILKVGAGGVISFVCWVLCPKKRKKIAESSEEDKER